MLSGRRPGARVSGVCYSRLALAGAGGAGGGRGSFTEAYPLFGYDLRDYDALFAEKLDLLLALRAQEQVTWQGRFRPALSGQGGVPAPPAGTAARVAGSRRYAGLVCAGRHVGPAPDGGHHWGASPDASAP
ncbi:LLM class flavin-dependent oxidoreductase [Hymenobacter sp. AT01-02]|uniref:LLM class flavin-dependent oxidoreductase n=1 Tax=Hymenobacter sp. AT01-02 TaxID=1571877 RepID=UPI000AECC95D